MKEIITGVTEISKLTGFSRKMIHAHIKKGTFPKPYQEMSLNKKGHTLKCWRKKDIDSYIKEIESKYAKNKKPVGNIPKICKK